RRPPLRQADTYYPTPLTSAAFKPVPPRLVQSHKLISETDPQHPGRLHDVAVQRHGAPTANRLGNPDGHGVRWLQRDHVTIHPVGNELHGAGAESGAQQTVERGRPATALQMAEHTNARFFASPFLDFPGDHRANPAEPGLAILFSS